MAKSNVSTVITAEEHEDGILVQVTTAAIRDFLMHQDVALELHHDDLTWPEILEWAHDSVEEGRVPRRFIFLEVVSGRRRSDTATN